MPHPPDKLPREPYPQPATLTDAERDELQTLLDRVPAPLEPLDVSMLDGFLCGVLVQPRPVPASRWLLHLTDADGRALPRGFDAARLQALAQRRCAELNDAIMRREWFDPWVFELSNDEDDAAGGVDDEGGEPSALEAVYPWVAGFATAMELFPQLMQGESPALTEPLALLYRHLDADDLEDADDLLEEIDSLEPPADLSEAVEGLVRATLLLADIGRPVAGAGAGSASKPARPGAGRASTRRPPPRRH